MIKKSKRAHFLDLKNGEVIWLEAIYIPVVDGNNNQIKIFKIAIDVTEK
tara:strand:- start:4701 stop:4847 length:147 start_codon:yes stop_codon:yes gene_type:complete